jgi:serine O-acetyltransferase
MIKTKADYNFYLQADKIALRMDAFRQPRILRDSIWQFERLLRKVEFYTNCKTGFFDKSAHLYARYRLEKLAIDLGFTIPCNTFGPGLSIAHRGTIVVGAAVRVGENCRIHQCVTIGSDPMKHDPIFLGNNIFIGPGAVIVGPLSIADGIAIGANSFVNSSFDEPNITIAGCPAKKVSNKSSEQRYIRATDILRGNGVSNRSV